jgi:hypothetical protein
VKPSAKYLRVDEVVEALRELNGEAEWREIEDRVTRRHGHSYRPYKDLRNFRHSMFQLVQRHCQGYQKFAGSIIFEKVRMGRFRLAPPRRVPQRKSQPPHTYKGILRNAVRYQPGGEGQDHRQLKEFIAANPQVIGLPERLRGKLEYRLPSGDCVDVLFDNAGEWIAVEVKARHSPDEDVVRGLFQCIKYHAVIEAYQTSRDLPPDARAVLVLEARLPEALIPLKNLLAVEVIDRVLSA